MKNVQSVEEGLAYFRRKKCPVEVLGHYTLKKPGVSMVATTEEEFIEFLKSELRLSPTETVHLERLRS